MLNECYCNLACNCTVLIMFICTCLTRPYRRYVPFQISEQELYNILRNTNLQLLTTRQTDSHTVRQTGTETNGRTDGSTDRRTSRWIDRRTDNQIDSQTARRQTYRQADMLTGWQTGDRHLGSEADWQTGRQPGEQTRRQADRKAVTQSSKAIIDVYLN